MSNYLGLLAQLERVETTLPGQPDIAYSKNGKEPARQGKLPTRHSEALNLVQRVFLTKPEAAPQVVVFASPQSGTGCSWVCARTAEVLAERFPEEVCVVDGNLHSPAMHRYFLVNNHRGLAQAIVEKDPISSYVQKVSNKRMSVLTTGVPSAKMTGPLSDRLVQRIAELRQQFTFLLVDSPATNLYADVAVLSAVADGAVLVLEADSTRRDVALQARNALLEANFRVLGAALNKRSFPIPEFIYKRL